MQRRYYAAGTFATVQGERDVNRSCFGPQLLWGADLSVGGTNQNRVDITQHGCVFESGMVLLEDETKQLTLQLGAAAANYSITYQHVSTTAVGDTPAVLALESGLLESSGTRCVVGWVVYPGGSVALTQSMLFRAARGQNVTPQQAVACGRSLDVVRSVQSAIVPKTYVEPWSVLTVPASSPYTVTLAAGDPLLASSYADSTLRLVNDSGAVLEEVSVLLGMTADQYYVDYGARTVTFHSDQAGNDIYGQDLTYGVAGWWFRNTTGSAVVDEFCVSYVADNYDPLQVSLDVIKTSPTAPTIALQRVIDTEGNDVTLDVDVLGATTSGSRIVQRARLLGGAFAAGKPWTAVWRITCAASSSYLLRYAAWTADDSPL